MRDDAGRLADILEAIKKIEARTVGGLGRMLINVIP